jgi:hypothetical protein
MGESKQERKPTDDDAKHRPMVEARNGISVPWERGMLVAVDGSCQPFNVWPDHKHYVKNYRYCRLLDETDGIC